MSISAPQTVRQWRRCPPINMAANDYTSKNGVRISLPVYIDLTTTQRKDILNAIREVINSKRVVSTPSTSSGLTVETTTNTESDVESYIGMSLDVLRSVIFQRGGIEAGLLLRLQEVAGLSFLTDKDMTAAFKARHDAVKNYLTEYPYEQPDTSS